MNRYNINNIKNFIILSEKSHYYFKAASRTDHFFLKTFKFGSKRKLKESLCFEEVMVQVRSIAQ